MEISVIIPVYNTEQYLEECLDSLAAQHFQDWECLLIDDGSTDGSGRICDLYARSDTRFRVFHTANSGAAAARNLGIANAAGKYLAFIDSDDTIEKNYLAELYHTAETTAADLTVGGIRNVRADGVEIAVSAGGAFPLCGENADRFVDLNRKFLLYGPTSKLYRSGIVAGNGIGFPAGVHYGEDLVFNFEYLEHVATIAVSEAANYNYRKTADGTLSTSEHSREFHGNYEQWKILRSFFERRGIDTPDARTFLSDRLWGLAYDTVLSRRLAVGQIKSIFDVGFIGDLRRFDSYTIAVPDWLRMAISKRWHTLIWLIQRMK